MNLTLPAPIPGPVLVTGATGFLGHRLVERLAGMAGGPEVIAVGRTLRPEAEVRSSNVVYALGDLSDPDFVGSLFARGPIRSVVHAAALSSPWGSDADFFRANVTPQQWLLAAAEKAGASRYVYISTPGVYFDYRHRWGVKESDPLPERFVNAYAATKRQAEQLLEDSPLSWIALRPRALVGRGDTVIMPRLIRACRENRLRIIGSGRNLVDLTPVSNVVDAILLSLAAPETACRQIYNISNGEPVRLWEFISETLLLLGIPPPTRRIPLWVADLAARWYEWQARRSAQDQEPVLTRYGVALLALSFSMDISMAQQRLRYTPRQTVPQAVEEYVSWRLSLPSPV